MLRKKKRVYPSQIRYYKKMPVVSFRLPAEEKQRLEDIAREKGISVSQLFKNYYEGIKTTDDELREELRKKNETELKREYDRGYQNGYKKAEDDWKIDGECPICFEKIYVKPHSNVHAEIKEFLHRSRWAHTKCAKREEKRNETFRKLRGY